MSSGNSGGFAGTAANLAAAQPKSASDQLASLYQQQWSDYLSKYGQEEQKQLGLLSDASNELEKNQAIGAVGSAYGRSLSDAQRQAFSYGAPLSKDQQMAYKQKLNLQQGEDTATAYNRTNTTQQDRSYGALGSFGGGQAGSSIFGAK